ncbi:MAG: Panacea domain-containing protein [Bacteroides sp.]|nr:Panacea domain-containing protein [Eubacterium sp.]MCM1417714.1 Panacea domain-containing protein [Roseburia sp.]MCM1463526.1 Panacea domain-containing protein [Bacteroides sp.]
MLTAIQVAQYFLSKDPNRDTFNKQLVTMNGRTFYAGNARLNKYLHMAQNLYIAKTGKQLFSNSLFAYDNGGVVPEVQENYAVLIEKKATCPEVNEEELRFLDKVDLIFRHASLDEMIEMSHEDEEWILHNKEYKKEDQRMDSLSRLEEYRLQYADILKVMDRM